MKFRREDRLRAHLLLRSHKTIIPPYWLLDKAAIIHKESLDSGNLKEIPILSATNSTIKCSTISIVNLEEGWALFLSSCERHIYACSAMMSQSKIS